MLLALPSQPPQGTRLALLPGGGARLPGSWAEPSSWEHRTTVPRTTWVILPSEEEGPQTQARGEGWYKALKEKQLPGATRTLLRGEEGAALLFPFLPIPP